MTKRLTALEEAISSIFVAAEGFDNPDVLKNVISDKLQPLISEHFELQIANETLIADLRASRESEETAYEKLKRLREISCARSSVCCCLDSRTYQLNRLPHATGLSTSRYLESSDLLRQRISRSNAAVETENPHSFCRMSYEPLDEWKVGLDSQKNITSNLLFDTSTESLEVSIRTLKAQLVTAANDLEAALRREKSLSEEAVILARMLSSRDHDVAMLRQQTMVLNEMLEERKLEISRLATLLEEERRRSERNREVAAKVRYRE